MPGATEGSATTSLQQGSYRTNTGTTAGCAALYAQGAAAVRAPAFAYDHSGGGASANAGAVYTGATYPAEYRGALFVADYNRRWIRYLTFDAQGPGHPPTRSPRRARPTARSSWSPVRTPTSTGCATPPAAARCAGSGTWGRATPPPVVQVGATPTIGQAPMPVSFTSTGSYDPDAQPFTYAWDFKDGTTSTAADPTHTYTTPGVRDVTLTLTETTAPFATATDTVRVTVGSNPPLATIVTPPDGTQYAIGDTLTFTGTGTSGGSPLPASALAWEIRHRHNEHVHYSTPAPGPSGTDPNVSVMTLVPDDHGDNTAYQVCLTADAGGGLTDTRCVELVPRTTDYTLATSPAGLVLQYEDEGLSLPGPALIRPIVGPTQTVSVDPVQQSRTFVRWSDGLTGRSRTFVVGTTPTTFTAVYENLLPTARITGGSGGAAPLTVALTGATSTDPEGDTLTYAWTDGLGGTSTAAAPDFTCPEPGTYRVGLTVTDQLGGTGTTSYDVVVTGLPVPWTTISIGAVTNPGSATWAAGTFTVSNAGPGITQNADAFRFVHQARTGDLTLVARVDSLTNTNVYAKAGLMVRETTAANSREVMLAATPRVTDGVKLIQRATPGATTTNVAYARNVVPPRWLKLVRAGDTVTGYQSADGVTWTTVGSTTVAMTSAVQVGLAVGSQATAVATARISGVQLT